MNRSNHVFSFDPSELGKVRRPFLRTVAGAGIIGALGLPSVATFAATPIPGVTIEYKRCKVAFVTNASALDAIGVYYADRNGERQGVYGISPTTADPSRRCLWWNHPTG